MRVSAHGLDVDVPRGWDGEIYKRPGGIRALRDRSEQTHAVLHLGNFPLPPSRGDYGSGAVEVMRADAVFISLFEFGAESVGKALFSAGGVPNVTADDFATHTLQRPMRGQSGAQFFFNHRGRAFCLYVVLGSHARRHELVPEVNQILGSLSVSST